MKVERLLKSFKRSDLYYETSRKPTGKRYIAMALTLRLFAIWTGDLTQRKKLKNSFNEQ